MIKAIDSQYLVSFQIQIDYPASMRHPIFELLNAENTQQNIMKLSQGLHLHGLYERYVNESECAASWLLLKE